MTTDIEPADLPAERLDAAVSAARDLCAKFRRVERRNGQVKVMGLPDKSALQGLLSFAQSTPSTTEAVLFVRYQATRLNRNRERLFLVNLADKLEADWSASVEELRRFLGILVRAGVVALTPDPTDRGAPERSRPQDQRR